MRKLFQTTGTPHVWKTHFRPGRLVLGLEDSHSPLETNDSGVEEYHSPLETNDSHPEYSALDPKEEHQIYIAYQSHRYTALIPATSAATLATSSGSGVRL